jgi:hypothetical protein
MRRFIAASLTSAAFLGTPRGVPALAAAPFTGTWPLVS